MWMCLDCGLIWRVRFTKTGESKFLVLENDLRQACESWVRAIEFVLFGDDLLGLKALFPFQEWAFTASFCHTVPTPIPFYSSTVTLPR